MLESQEIRRRLPHRYPLLLIDKIIEITDDRILGEKYVSASEPFFRGHFPTAPVMPGVLILESMFQLLWFHQGGSNGLHLCGVKRLKLRRSVIPGDILELEARVLEMTETTWSFKCFGRIEGKIAAEGELIVRPREKKSVLGNSLSQRETATT